MDELERALRAVLDDPAQLTQLRTMAGALGLGTPERASAAQSLPEQPPPSASPRPEPPALPEGAAALLRQAGTVDKKQQSLLLALKPFLRKERQEKIERALRAAQLASLAGLALKNRRDAPEQRRHHDV